jgi:hypothetical protein
MTRTALCQATALGTAQATGTLTKTASATFTVTAVTTTTETVSCTVPDYCVDEAGKGVAGCNALCGGLASQPCPSAELVCLKTPTLAYDGPTGHCIAPRALRCSSVADCAGLPAGCYTDEPANFQWTWACSSSGKCEGVCAP